MKMSLLEAILYGLVQGITEYLPISSSAHLVLLPKFLGTQDPGLTFDVFLHIGTLAATVLYFRGDWVAMIKRNSWNFHEVNLFTIGVATFPALAVGALLHSQIETVFRGTAVVASALAVGGLALFALDKWMPASRSLGEFRFRDALVVGFVQCLALVPGVSRSGSTIMAGRLLKFDRVSAARFSFLISAPVTAAAIAYEMLKWRELVESTVGVSALIAATISSFVFGWLAIDFLLKLVKRFSFFGFAVYRVVLAVVIFRVLIE